MSSEINVDAMQQIKELMGDNFQGLIETYLRTNAEHVEKLRAGFDAGDAQMIVNSAHPMKSSAGNLGLSGLSASAAELEAAAKEVVESGSGLEALEALISTIEGQFERGSEHLNNALNS